MTTAVTRQAATARGAAPRTSAGRRGRFAGTGALVRLALRRDRVLVPVWIAVFVATAVGQAASVASLYPDAPSWHQLAESVNTNPSLLALYGRVLSDATLGGVALFKVGAFGAVFVGLLSIILVVRHTRAEEDTGRTELLGSTVVGRSAPLAAALIVVLGTDLVLGLLTAGGLVATGLDAAGSLAFGLGWAMTGMVFAGVAAVAAQVASVARGATGLAGVALAVAYVLRGAADSSADGSLTWVSWLSPVGWSQQVRPFAGERWWVLGLGLALTVVLAVAAFRLVERRDLGAGLLPDRPGAATAGRWLSDEVGLAWRLHRGTTLTWALAFAALGSIVGGLVANVAGFIDDATLAILEKLGGTGTLVDAYLATEWAFIGIFTAVFAVQAMLRLRGEETSGHGEPLLATALTRTRWAASHLLMSAGGAAALLAIGGLTAGLSCARAFDDPTMLGRMLQAAAVQLPAVLVLVGLTLAATALAPRWASAISWGAVVAFLLLGELGPLLRLPQWAMDLSPFAHTPRLPAADFSWPPVLWLTAVGLGLIGVGLVGFRRRDLD